MTDVEITTERAAAWAERYFRAWKTNDPGEVASLFAEDAVYFYGPFREPARGREEIVRRWIAGVQHGVESEHDLVAVSGDRAVVQWRVSFDHGAGRMTLDGVLIARFDACGLCCEHREWYAGNLAGLPPVPKAGQATQLKEIP